MAVKLQARAVNTRRKILASAVSCFSECGLNGTTVDSIANHAGVNKQRIYAYFGSKQKLFEAALLDVFDNVKLWSASVIEEAKAHPDQLTGIVFASFMRVHKEQPDLWRLLAWANLEVNECADVLSGVRSEENNALRDVFHAAQAKGLITDVKFEVWLFSLLGLSCFYHSNQLTMVHTLGTHLADDNWKTELAVCVQKLFSKA